MQVVTRIRFVLFVHSVSNNNLSKKVDKQTYFTKIVNIISWSLGDVEIKRRNTMFFRFWKHCESPTRVRNKTKIAGILRSSVTCHYLENSQKFASVCVVALKSIFLLRDELEQNYYQRWLDKIHQSIIWKCIKKPHKTAFSFQSQIVHLVPKIGENCNFLKNRLWVCLMLESCCSEVQRK